MIAGSLSARDHSERLMGFRRDMQERYSHLTLLPAVEGNDDADTVAQLVTEAADTQSLVGIYAIGAGNRGLVDAIKKTGIKPITIAHELTPEARERLRDGTIDLVLDQDTSAAIASAVNIMRSLTEGRDLPTDAGKIRLNIYNRENIL
jgi:LacI family transcriptional regulator